jgi:hypothetical protein
VQASIFVIISVKVRAVQSKVQVTYQSLKKKGKNAPNCALQKWQIWVFWWLSFWSLSLLHMWYLGTLAGVSADRWCGLHLACCGVEELSHVASEPRQLGSGPAPSPASVFSSVQCDSSSTALLGCWGRSGLTLMQPFNWQFLLCTYGSCVTFQCAAVKNTVPEHPVCLFSKGVE